MALYSLKDVKNNAYEKPDFRTLKLEAGVKNAKKLWIPEFKFAYKRTHFNVQKFTKFTNAKFNTLDCFNQMLGERGKGCPICEIVDELWEKWRGTKDKEQKQQYTSIINRIMNEEYWLNLVDLSDPNKAFTAARFTITRFKDLADAQKEMELKGKDISDLIFTFAMTKDGNITKYSLTWDEDQPEKTKHLQDTYETMLGRAYEDGGPIDLEKCIISRTRTIDEYNDILHNSEGDEGHREDSSEKKSDKKEPPKKDAPKTKEKEAKVDEETLSLDDVGLSEDELGGAFAEDVKPSEPVKLVDVSAKKIVDEKANKEYITPLYEYLVANKAVAATEQYPNRVKAVFEYVKEKKGIQVPESVFVKKAAAKAEDDLELDLD
jgi:hypothetical protein